MPADIVLRVEPNDDPMLSCWLCGGRSDHIPRPRMTTFYRPEGRTSVGLHQRCYDRAMTPIKPIAVTPRDTPQRQDASTCEEVTDAQRTPV